MAGKTKRNLRRTRSRNSSVCSRTSQWTSSPRGGPERASSGRGASGAGSGLPTSMALSLLLLTRRGRPRRSPQLTTRRRRSKAYSSEPSCSSPAPSSGIGSRAPFRACFLGSSSGGENRAGRSQSSNLARPTTTRSEAVLRKKCGIWRLETPVLRKTCGTVTGCSLRRPQSNQR